MGGAQTAGARAGGRIDLDVIAGLVAPGSRVLDIGCGDGELLLRLAARRGVEARGMELSQDGVNACVAQGLAVVQGDAGQDLDDYPDRAFDFAILSQTIQAVQRPRAVLEAMLRLSAHAIVSLPNFGHWRVRGGFAFTGKMPVTGLLPHEWHETPNIHLCSIADFASLTGRIKAAVERFIALDAQGRPLRWNKPGGLANFFAAQAIFVLSRPPRRAGTAA